LYNTTIIHLYHSRYTSEDYNFFFIHLAMHTFDYYTFMVRPVIDSVKQLGKDCNPSWVWIWNLNIKVTLNILISHSFNVNCEKEKVI